MYLVLITCFYLFIKVSAGKQQNFSICLRNVFLPLHEIQLSRFSAHQLPDMIAKCTFTKVLCVFWNLLKITYFSSHHVPDQQKLFTG